jgi:hypothetical protein
LSVAGKGEEERLLGMRRMKKMRMRMRMRRRMRKRMRKRRMSLSDRPLKSPTGIRPQSYIKRLTNLFFRVAFSAYINNYIKGIVSQDWGGLLMVLLDRYKVLDIIT